MKILGEQNRSSTYRPLQGHWKVWLCEVTIGPCTKRRWVGLRYHFKEGHDHGRHLGLLQLDKRQHQDQVQLLEGNFQRFGGDLQVLDTRLLGRVSARGHPFREVREVHPVR